QIADYCLIDVLERDGELQRVGVGVAPSVPLDVRELVERTKLSSQPPGRAGLLHHVLETAEVELTPEVGADWINGVADSDQSRRMLERMEPKSALIVPLVARQRTLGAITL